MHRGSMTPNRATALVPPLPIPFPRLRPARVYYPWSTAAPTGAPRAGSCGDDVAMNVVRDEFATSDPELAEDAIRGLYVDQRLSINGRSADFAFGHSTLAVIGRRGFAIPSPVTSGVSC